MDQTLRPYSICYVDKDHQKRVFCTYAESSYEARQQAQEMVQAIQHNANCIYWIRRELEDHNDFLNPST